MRCRLDYGGVAQSEGTTMVRVAAQVRFLPNEHVFSDNRF